MLFVGDGAALAARVVCAALLAGVGAVDDPVREDVQAVKSRTVLARREIDLMAGSGGERAGGRGQGRGDRGQGRGDRGEGTGDRNYTRTTVIPAKAGIHVRRDQNGSPLSRG